MKRTLARLDSPLAPTLLIAAAAGLFVFGVLRANGFDASWFVTAGDRYCDPARVPPGLSVRPNSDGFDGQFYYRLALDPLASRRTDYGITLDVPALRHQRILYPLLARALSFGSARLLPWAMILINFAALCLLGWLGGLYARSLQKHALWGVFPATYPGSLLTLTRDLVELSEVALLVGSLLLLRRGRHVAATLLLVLAVLAKETALLVAVGAALVYAADWLRGRGRRVRWHYFAAPLAVFVLWQAVLFYNWGEVPVFAGRINLAAPFKGFAGFLADAAQYRTPLQRRALPELLYLVAFAAAVLYCVRSTLAWAHEIICWLLYGALALLLSRAIWVEDWTFLRAVTEFCVLGAIILVGSRSRVRVPIFACSLAFWLFLFLRLLRHGD
ncbi:MAG TPA: hypothetical protein VK421_03030 [Pyrinomonadaceae bacterium]|nr:hypothetical protein [Pyrinomonadaceae bacterium]